MDSIQTPIIDILIVGGGYSAIPLIRELEKDGKDFLIISEGKPIWSELETSNRLDFDLVSSLYSSVFSFELVEMAKSGPLADIYPTSKEFYDLHKRYARKYESKTIRDRVVKIDNYDDHSLVYLRSGTTYKANCVIVATAFERVIHGSITEFEFNESLNRKTVAVTSIGDSANLIIAKLVAFGANVKLVANGFFALDKLLVFRGYESTHDLEITVDQLEYQNIAKYFPFLYERTITAGHQQSILFPRLAKLLYGPSLAAEHPLTRREDQPTSQGILRVPFLRRKAPFLNGVIAIKYWPIDTYMYKFADNLEEHIKKGFLLNDLPFLIDQNLVELWSKEKTEILRDKKEIRSEGKTCKYDFIVDGDRERPALPPIYRGGSEQSRFDYAYRDQFMGVVPRDLSNVYLLGYTRPTTGGLSNIVEMQCLLIHKMMEDAGFKDGIVSSIDTRITDYNNHHYLSDQRGPSDHLVWYGFYTDEIAKLVGIQPRLRDCRSFYDLCKYFLYPNSSLYFREHGEYQVQGADLLVAQIMEDHFNFIGLGLGLVRYTLMEFAAIATLLLLPIPLWAAIPLALLHFNLPITAFLYGKLGLPSIDRKYGMASIAYAALIDIPLLLCPLALLVVGSIWIPAGVLASTYLLVNLGCWMGWNRKVFNDLRSMRKSRYRKFFSNYKKIFVKVFTSKTSSEMNEI